MMNGYSEKEKSSILTAKLNEITSLTEKDEKELKDMSSIELTTTLMKVYPESNRVECCRKLIDFLRETKEPIYVELARILEIINKKYKRENSVDIDSAEVVIKNLNERGKINNIKTTYKEFQQIQKRKNKISLKTKILLKKYEEVEKFYKKELVHLWNDILDIYGEHSNLKYDSFEQNEVINFLNNHNSLKFLSYSKEIKKFH